MKLVRPKLLLSSLLTMCLAGFAGAASLTINNASFEGNDIRANGGSAWADGVPNGWTSQEDVAGTADPLTVDGVNLLFLEESADIGSAGGDGINYLGLRTGSFAYQDLGVVFQPNTTYTVDLLVSRRGAANTVGFFGITDSSVVGNAGNPSLLGTAGGTDTSAFTLSDQYLAASSLTAAQGNVATFTTGGTVPTGNVFLAVGGTTGNVIYDLVSVDASAVPEPSSMAFLAMMTVGFFRRRR